MVQRTGHRDDWVIVDSVTKDHTLCESLTEVEARDALKSSVLPPSEITTARLYRLVPVAEAGRTGVYIKEIT